MAALLTWRAAAVGNSPYGRRERTGASTKVTVGLIIDRAIVRDAPPSTLLTNYKMLDQLLLRSADQRLWEKSAD